MSTLRQDRPSRVSSGSTPCALARDRIYRTPGLLSVRASVRTSACLSACVVLRVYLVLADDRRTIRRAACMVGGPGVSSRVAAAPDNSIKDAPILSQTAISVTEWCPCPHIKRDGYQVRLYNSHR